MPPRRSQPHHWETAAPDYEQGSGCFSAFMLPPLMVVLFSVAFAYLVWDKDPRALKTPGGIAPIFRQEIQVWAGDIVRWAEEAGLDPNLVATVMQIESCGNPRARSSAGAMGLFQVMPYHFGAGEDPYQPETNARRGLAFLARALQSAQGDIRLALAGYNGGLGVITRSDWTWAAETRRYVQYGAPIYADARNGLAVSPALEEWYQSYGVSLCRQAQQQLGLP